MIGLSTPTARAALVTLTAKVWVDQEEIDALLLEGVDEDENRILTENQALESLARKKVRESTPDLDVNETVVDVNYFR